MIPCLTLVRYSHIRVAHEASRSVTACGLAIEQAHVSDGMFAAGAAEATCPSCLARTPANPSASTVPDTDVGTFARWFVEFAVGARQPCNLAQICAVEIAGRFAQARIQRLHALFCELSMTVDEVVAQGTRAFVRFTVTCRDQSGLIGAAGDRLSLRQAIILEYVDGRVTRIEPVVDDLGFWSIETPDRAPVKLATFRHGNRHKIGIVDGDCVYDASGDPGGPQDMVALLEAGAEAIARMAAARSRLRPIPLAEVVLCAPVVRPRKFLGIGLNYHGHRNELAERGAQLPPVGTQMWFNKQVTCLAGPADPIHLPRVSAALDYEGELACVIGRRCRHVSAEDAGHVIAGYMVANDVSVRDWQAASPTGTLGKSFDTHGPCGPWLTTADEVGDPNNLYLRTIVDGVIRQDGHTGDMIVSIGEMIAHLSKVFTLEPGDILLTGTPSGVGQSHDPPCFLKVGQTVRVEIERLGAIENIVMAEPVPAGEPA